MKGRKEKRLAIIFLCCLSLCWIEGCAKKKETKEEKISGIITEIYIPEKLPRGWRIVKKIEVCPFDPQGGFYYKIAFERSGLRTAKVCKIYEYESYYINSRRKITPRIFVYSFNSVQQMRYALNRLARGLERIRLLKEYIEIMDRMARRRGEANDPEWQMLKYAYNSSKIEELYVEGDGDSLFFPIRSYIIRVVFEEYPQEQIEQLKTANIIFLKSKK